MKRFRLAAFAFTLGFSCLSYSADRVALVIGVNQYDHLGPESQLEVSVSDAELMAKTLGALEPTFDVTLLTDVNQDDAEDALDTFIDKADGAECALLYFAGHGVEYYGENFLLVRDTDIDKISSDVPRMKRRLGNEALSLQAWVDSLDTTGAKVKVVILDACRDNPLKAEDGSGTRSLVGSKGGLAQVTPPSGSLISYSADAGQQANDGLFTMILAEKLTTPGLPLLQVFAATREDVLKISTEMASKSMGVRHEPAEYTKLNLAGTKFSFMPNADGSTNPGAAPPSSDAEMVLLKKELEMLRKKLEGGDSMPADRGEEPEFSPAYRSLAGEKAGEIRNFVGNIEFVWCPPTGPDGFLMGSPEDEYKRRSNEPQRRVILTKGFWMGRYECTQGMWKSVMGSNPSHVQGPSWGPHIPVEKVTWNDAQEWCRKMNQKYPLGEGWEWALPTEAQWEYACRAGTTTPYYTGTTLTKEQANFDTTIPAEGKPPTTHGNITKKVGSYPPNPWGIYDMHGNVAEFCYDAYQDAGFIDGAKDPVGPADGENRVLRGGSFYEGFFMLRSAQRGYISKDMGLLTSGFRPAIVPKRD
ncbi:MAG: hypothetical protein CMO55_01890 [Verrucomicrobiales bacterium]|nr:hypothetical protein [Verrucomicrobiales bacterium]